MKASVRLGVLAAAGGLALAALLLTVRIGPSAGKMPSPAPESLSAVAAAAYDAKIYLVRSLNDFVAVYDRDDPAAPAETTAIRVSSLRETDQRLLNAGVTVYGEENLVRFLEDFGP